MEEECTQRKMSGFLSECDPCDSSSQNSMISTQLRDMQAAQAQCVQYETCSVFHCANSKCNLVLGDSLGACGEIKWIKAIICLSKGRIKNALF